jgi:hypothetical protein
MQSKVSPPLLCMCVCLRVCAAIIGTGSSLKLVPLLCSQAPTPTWERVEILLVARSAWPSCTCTLSSLLKKECWVCKNEENAHHTLSSLGGGWFGDETASCVPHKSL